MNHVITTPHGALSPAEALFALYNNYPVTPVYGAELNTFAGLLRATEGRNPLTMEEAAAMLERSPYVDYLRGKPIKTDFGDETLRLALYDRDAGPGAGMSAIETYIKSKKETP